MVQLSTMAHGKVFVLIKNNYLNRVLFHLPNKYLFYIYWANKITEFISMDKRQNILFVLLLILSSCGFYTTDITGAKRRNENASISFPVGHKKAKNRINPTIGFVEAIKFYRQQMKVFPQSIQQLEYYSEKNKASVRDMRELGFKEMTVTFCYLDSMVIDFVHTPVYTQRVGTIDMKPDVKGSFTFVMKDSSFYNYTKIK